MKKPLKLYVKNERGRYEEYRDPEPPYNNMLYKKVTYRGKVRYEPYSMNVGQDLSEGVWVITKSIYGKSYTSGMYLRDMFMCQKASDIQEMSLSELGGMEKLARWLCHNWGNLPRNTSTYDLCRAIVGILFKYHSKEDKSLKETK